MEDQLKLLLQRFGNEYSDLDYEWNEGGYPPFGDDEYKMREQEWLNKRDCLVQKYAMEILNLIIG